MTQFDQAEARRLVETYSDLILRLSFTYLKSTYDAEDICQTVFLKLLTTPQDVESPQHETAWIIRAAVYACKDELRAFRRRSVPLDQVAESAAPPVPDSDILEAVAALPEKYREALFLYYYEGYSIREICDLLGQSEAAVTTRLSRGRQKLRVELGGEQYEQSI